MKIGILSDIHEDIVSLQKAFRIFDKESCGEIICLGDIVGCRQHYYKYLKKRNVSECIKLIKQNCKVVISGNHDLYAIKKIPEYKGGFDYPNNWYQLDLNEKQKLSKGKVWLYQDELPNNLTQDEKEYLSSLNEFSIVEIGGVKFFFSHFVFPDITGSATGFTQNKKNINLYLAFLKNINCTIGLCGHIHADGMILFRERKNIIFSYFQKNFDYFPFGRYCLKKEWQRIAIPAVVNDECKNGIAVFDTNNFEINFIRIK